MAPKKHHLSRIMAWFLLVFLAGMFLLMFGAGWGLFKNSSPADRESGASALLAVPNPDPSQLDPPAREKLAVLQQRLRVLETESGVTGTELGAVYGELGMYYHAHGFLEPARVCYQNALTLMPGRFRWVYYLAVTSKELNQPNQTMSWYRKAIEIDPHHVPSLVAMGEIFHLTGQNDQAKQHYAQALERDATCTAAHLGLGVVALAERDFSAVITHAKRVLELDAKATNAHKLLSAAYENLGELGLAREHERRQGEGWPAIVDPLMVAIRNLKMGETDDKALGVQAARAGRFGEALEHLQRARERHPRDAALYLNIGEVNRMLGERERAVDAFEQVVAFSNSPGLTVMARAHLGDILGELGQDGRALEHLSAAYGIHPRDTATNLHLADTLRRTGRFEDALPHYETVIEQVPANPAARLGRAYTLIRLNRHIEARDLLRQDIRAIPDEAAFQHAFARLLAASDNASVRDGQTAVQIANGLAHLSLTSELAETTAMAFAEIGDFDSAVRWQERALTLAGREGVADRDHFQKNLDLYRNRQPCRQPWPEHHPVFTRRTFRPSSR